MNWAGLQDRIYEATKLAFKGLGEKYPSKDFYAYVLYTDSDAMSISPSANSMEDLNYKIGQELKDEEKTEENIAYYRWASAEWAHEAGGGEFFKEINRDLRESGDRSEFDTFKIKVLQAMTGALEQLVKDRFFHISTQARQQHLTHTHRKKCWSSPSLKRLFPINACKEVGSNAYINSQYLHRHRAAHQGLRPR
ncbi:DUF4303 domain-containing protein [Pseudomonas sp. GD03842]|uniref:DUF4303 domain-containing protein n=1 Tax=Pseudomonas sp. GD03842 TaxID=2975385 RepID=UPI00244C93DB|nr:DUF4303 domain-containing protein [Pseudomonas sp. GD03842]MDH0745189.1 DUF4303 domain-containing protein [Pseudomonas sp. GD03842]